MKKLGKREEQIMWVFWDLEKAFIKEIIAGLPEPKPHYNSVATMIKILEEKGYLQHEEVGNMFLYSPLITKEVYQKSELKDVMHKYFNNSIPSMLAYFAKEEEISQKELEEIHKLIKSE